MFLILFNVFQVLQTIYSKYFHPLEVVRESDFDELDDKEEFNVKTIYDATVDAILE